MTEKNIGESLHITSVPNNSIAEAEKKAIQNFL